MSTTAAINKVPIAIKASILACLLLFSSFLNNKKEVVIYLIGDSTVADYSLEEGYMEKRFPLVGWGQMFHAFFAPDSLPQLRHLIGKTHAVRIDDRAKGGRSTRTFFQEGRWREVYDRLNKGDIVMMQFGHNDGSESHTERYVPIEGYKEFLRLFILQTRQKGAIPILLTPVARNYPWKEGKLANVHGDYPAAVLAIAKEQNVRCIDLNALSMNLFTSKGQAYVTQNYFMNIPSGKYKAYPEGQKDNTHFQAAGGTAVAALVFNALKEKLQ